MARMRATAAHVWFLTIYSKAQDDPGIKLGVLNMWMMLQMVKVDELVKDAKIFTGTYFDGVRSDSMNFKDWPHQA